jgi:hypothetical protein
MGREAPESPTRALSKPHHGLRVGELWALLADELRRDGEGVLGRYPLCAMRS